MGLFSFRKKAQHAPGPNFSPYKDSAANFIYNLIFCDDLDIYREKTEQPYSYPFDILFAANSSISALQNIIDDSSTDPRVKLLAYNRQVQRGHQPVKKELLAVIVEVGLDGGLDVLAAFNNGTARYINQTGKIIVWETATAESESLSNRLFTSSEQIIAQIGPWNQARKAPPLKGNVRISFLVSDGLYFGEGPMNTLFNDALAGPSLGAAGQLMQYLVEKSLNQQKAEL